MDSDGMTPDETIRAAELAAREATYQIRKLRSWRVAMLDDRCSDDRYRVEAQAIAAKLGDAALAIAAAADLVGSSVAERAGS